MTAETVAEGELSRARRDLRLAVNDLKAMRSTMRAAGLSAEEDTLQGMVDAYGDARVALDRALRATPPDGAVVWLSRDGERHGTMANMWTGQPYWDAGEEMWRATDYSVSEDEVQWYGPLLIDGLAVALGLAPGACQRFRLAPIEEGETP